MSVSPLALESVVRSRLSLLFASFVLETDFSSPLSSLRLRSWELEKLAGGGEPASNGNGNTNGVKKEAAKAEPIEDMSMDDDHP